MRSAVTSSSASSTGSSSVCTADTLVTGRGGVETYPTNHNRQSDQDMAQLQGPLLLTHRLGSTSVVVGLGAQRAVDSVGHVGSDLVIEFVEALPEHGSVVIGGHTKPVGCYDPTLQLDRPDDSGLHGSVAHGVETDEGPVAGATRCQASVDGSDGSSCERHVIDSRGKSRISVEIGNGLVVVDEASGRDQFQLLALAASPTCVGHLDEVGGIVDAFRPVLDPPLQLSLNLIASAVHLATGDVGVSTPAIVESDLAGLRTIELTVVLTHGSSNLVLDQLVHIDQIAEVISDHGHDVIVGAVDGPPTSTVDEGSEVGPAETAVMEFVFEHGSVLEWEVDGVEWIEFTGRRGLVLDDGLAHLSDVQAQRFSSSLKGWASRILRVLGPKDRVPEDGFDPELFVGTNSDRRIVDGSIVFEPHVDLLATQQLASLGVVEANDRFHTRYL
ncbi:MAG: hypothetical protein [Podoviridae sp. ctda_1]|nr:MAG: hypothetical protein [Podoviridae sp. ctda_1]